MTGRTKGEPEGTLDISVVVPFYNARRYIENCAAALISQHYPRDLFEIIMVDNNSTDGSADLVGRFPRIRLFSETKQGSYAARNCGVGRAKGRLLAFLDPDCIPAPGWIEEIRRAMLDPDVQLVLGRREYPPGSLALSMLGAYEIEKIAYICERNERQIYFGFTNNMAVRREVFERYGPFLEIGRGADSIFVRQVVDHCSCAAVHYAPRMLVRHMEIRSIWDFYHKRIVYGRSYEKYRKIRSARALGSLRRLHIAKRTIDKNGYSIPQSLLFLGLLCVGAAHFDFGRLMAKERSRRPPSMSRRV